MSTTPDDVLPAVPEPWADLTTRTNRTELADGTLLVRCHRAPYAPTQFNAGHGAGGRFHFFSDVDGRKVPVLYAADSAEGAVAETMLRDVPLRGFRFVAGHVVAHWSTTDVAVDCREAPLKLAQLHDPGLLRLGLRPANLTDTGPSHYPRTRLWAAAVHAQLEWAQGLVWVSARYNTSRAYVLFGDRVDPERLVQTGAPRPLDRGEGFEWLRATAADAGIMISRPAA